MNRRSKGFCLFVLFALVFWGPTQVGAGSHPATIEYKQVMTRILQENQFTGWPTGQEDYARSFQHVTNSADGSKIAFTVGTSIGNSYYQHLYVANADGTGIADLTGSLPGAVNPDTLSFLQMTESGSYVFFRDPSVGLSTDIYYCDSGTPSCAKAVNPQPGYTQALHTYDGRKPYSLTQIGDQITLFFKHYGGYDSDTGKYHRGIYSAPLGGTPGKVMDLDLLPGDKNMNFLRFLGSGAGAGEIIYTWNEDYWNPPGTAMWKGASPTKVPNEEHTYVWDKQDLPQKIISANGSVALYHYMDACCTTYLAAVDLASGTKRSITQTNDLNGYFAPTLSPTGTYAFFSTAGFKRTRVNLARGDKRDTFSSLFKESGCTSEFGISDITADDRYYFMASKCLGDMAEVHLIDMVPTDFSKAPNVTAIDFSGPALLHDETTTIAITAQISDAQGLGTIEWVKMHTLVDGLENPIWMSNEPLDYDPVLYDDGTHGDQTAGDGIYTNNTLKTDGDSEFYANFTLPHNCGIRIVAKDDDDNYVIADTVLCITDNMSRLCRVKVIPWFLLFDD